MSDRLQGLVDFVRSLYGQQGFIPLHAPVFSGNERAYLMECMDSTFVSSVGPFVDRFEVMMAEITGAKHAIAAMNGTAALHMSLIVSGVKPGDEVITQPLSFVATPNAISYQFAHPVFLDVDRNTLGLSADALRDFLQSRCEKVAGGCRNKATGRRIAAVVPMHTFGHPVTIPELVSLCADWQIPLIEDAAESLGSSYQGRHTGTFGLCGAFSFNGNKTVTCGGGGCIVTNDSALAKHVKHLTTTAKVPHRWEFSHDEIGYNYRLPNINAALACAQLERLTSFVEDKRMTANSYASYCGNHNITFIKEPFQAHSNYWLNAVLLENRKERDDFLSLSNDQAVMTRPVWKLLHGLPAFAHCECGPLDNSLWLEERLVNIPSSVRLK